MTGGRWSRRNGAAWLLGAVLIVLSVGGCTHDNPAPSTAPTVRQSPTTAAPSPTVTPPTPPVAPKEAPTQKSAEAFVRYFWDVHNYSYATLNTALLQSISEPDCTFCNSTIKDIAGLKAAGTVVDGSAVELILVVAPPSKIATGIIVASVISQNPGTLTRSDNSIRKIPGLARTQSYVSLDWTGKKWFTADVAISKSGKTS